jgi:hypothetical protein
MTAREFAIGEAGLDEETAAKVVKEAAQGKEKSDFVDADTYADIVKFKNFEDQREAAKAYGEQIEVAKQSLESARAIGRKIRPDSKSYQRVPKTRYVRKRDERANQR